MTPMAAKRSGKSIALFAGKPFWRVKAIATLRLKAKWSRSVVRCALKLSRKIPSDISPCAGCDIRPQENEFRFALPYAQCAIVRAGDDKMKITILGFVLGLIATASFGAE